MSLYAAGNIDLLGQLPDGTVMLSIGPDGPWVDPADERAVLSDKVNAYLSYALDGALTEDRRRCHDPRPRVQHLVLTSA